MEYMIRGTILDSRHTMHVYELEPELFITQMIVSRIPPCQNMPLLIANLPEEPTPWLTGTWLS